MLLVYSEVAVMVDDGLVVDMLMLDFLKAFDVVSHMVLLRKLKDWSVWQFYNLDLGDFLQIVTCVLLLEEF